MFNKTQINIKKLRVEEKNRSREKRTKTDILNDSLCLKLGWFLIHLCYLFPNTRLQESFSTSAILVNNIQQVEVGVFRNTFYQRQSFSAPATPPCLQLAEQQMLTHSSRLPWELLEKKKRSLRLSSHLRVRKKGASCHHKHTHKLTHISRYIHTYLPHTRIHEKAALQSVWKHCTKRNREKDN